jgi:serine/threonine protein kinase
MDAYCSSLPPGYEVREEIARDRHSVVYRAWQSHPGRPVALEVLHAIATTPPVSAALSLEHPHIVPLYDAGLHDGRPYLCMRLIEGRSLARLLLDGPLDPRAAAWIVARVARALHHAHERGIRHGRLTPSRVLLDRTGLPYVAGFGLGRGADDLYALGALLRACQAGQGTLPGAPADRDLALICRSCLYETFSPRYHSARALADDLDRWLAGRGIGPRWARSTGGTWRWVRGILGVACWQENPDE